MGDIYHGNLTYHYGFASSHGILRIIFQSLTVQPICRLCLIIFDPFKCPGFYPEAFWMKSGPDTMSFYLADTCRQLNWKHNYSTNEAPEAVRIRKKR